jgi:hypothetical protein
MAERTGLIAIHREMLVIEHHFAKQLDLLHLIIRRCGQPLESFCLDAIDLGLDLGNFLQGSGRKRYACLLRPHCSAAQRGKHGYGRSGNPGVHLHDLVSSNVIPEMGPIQPQRSSATSARAPIRFEVVTVALRWSGKRLRQIVPDLFYVPLKSDGHSR